MNELLKITDLTVKFYTYEGSVQALDHVNLDINQEETFGLVGETGSGKTMTALSILRLIPPPGKIEKGSIYFNLDNEALDLLSLNEDEIREIRGAAISMVFQEPSAALNPVFTIGDQITEVILLHRRKEIGRRALEAVNHLLWQEKGLVGILAKPAWLMQKILYRAVTEDPNSILPRFFARIPIVRKLLWRLRDEANKITTSLLREAEIPDPIRIARQHPHELSGGMKQRAVIAMTLACSPKLLIADEPTTSLDVTIQAQILELIRRLKREHHASVLYITHDLSVAAEICDRIGVMYAGSLLEVASAEELYTEPLHPYTQALLAAVPKPGEEPLPIGGTVPDPMNLPSGCRFCDRCSRAEDRCDQNVPEMLEVTPGHFVACHY